MTDTQKNSPPKEAEAIQYVNLYESEQKIYVRKITGYFQSVRRYTGIPLLLGFLLLPWFVIDGRPAVYFDLAQRQFNILWITFGPQDGLLLAFLLIISAFALFTVTAFLGRVWCGFTCPQTVWTLMFMWAERVCEGDRNKRIKLDNSDWSAEKVTRKSGKYLLWFVIAFVTGATFVGYFYPIRDLLIGFVPSYNESGLLVFDTPISAIFWTLFFTVMTYMNAGFLREQVCKYMCPYARFQSVMYDEDTLAVHYDAARGESRGARKADEDYKAAGKGDCVDCSWCVQVCPVDIDIRDGLQYECINCGLCVDACNTVMDKVGYERGLIRFTSEDQLKNGKTHFFRWRIAAYIGILLVMCGAFTFHLVQREPVTVDIDRDRGARMYRVINDRVQNVYTVKVHNMDRVEHTFDLQVKGPHDFVIKRYRALPIEQNEIFSFPVRIEVDKNALTNTKTEIEFTIISREDSSIIANEKTTFIGPSSE